jgi:hypothetical protein
MKKLFLLVLIPLVMPAFAQKWAKDYDFVDNPNSGLSMVKLWYPLNMMKQLRLAKAMHR